MPPTSHQLRRQIEAALAQRIPAALTPLPQAIRPTAPTGIPGMDQLLGGGLPIGAISEIAGPASSGRTTLALAFLAHLTHAGQVAAWVDVSDALDPESTAASGVLLDHLLWVRCGLERTPRVSPPQPVQHQPLPLFPPEAPSIHGGGCGSPHPRNEIHGLDTAIADLMQRKSQFVRDKTIATPSARNLALHHPHHRVPRSEQVPIDRRPARRGNALLPPPRCAEPQHAPRPHQVHYPAPTAAPAPLATRRTRSSAQQPWSRLDQALRVTDLLLQAGGFGAIVLDLAGIAPEFATRIPLATWFRYRAAAERTRTSLLLLTLHPCAKSSAGIVLRMDHASPSPGSYTVFTGMDYAAELLRQRFTPAPLKVVPLRKPPQSERSTAWRSNTRWSTGQ